MTKPRCLVLTPRVPWPQDDGGAVGLWRDLMAVTGAFETRLLTLQITAAPPPPVPAALETLGVRVRFVPHRLPPLPLAILRGTLGRWPHTLARFRSPAFDREVRSTMDAWQPEIVFIHHLHMATYVDAMGGATKVLRQHNLEQLFLARFADATRNPAVRGYARLQALRMRSAEVELCRAMSLILAMHEEEAQAMRAFAPGVRVEAIPVGAPFVELGRRARWPEPTLLVVGSFDREANAEGAKTFLEQGWPRVRSKMPLARLRIVGRGIAPPLAALALAAGAEPVGFVPDLEPELARAWGMVVPLWYGSGMRVKTVEAMAAGLPVACTPLGAEGLGLEAGRHYVEARTAAELGTAALALLGEPERAAARAAAAHEALRPTHALERRARRIVQLCEEARARAGRPHAGGESPA